MARTQPDGSHVGKIKDLEVPSKTLTGTSRGFEEALDWAPNPKEARSIAGSGNQGFGRSGSGPEAAHGFDRGQFASRTKHDRGNEKGDTGGSKGRLLPGEKD